MCAVAGTAAAGGSPTTAGGPGESMNAGDR